MARKSKPERIQERTGLSDADMMKVLRISRVSWWRWSTGKTPWAKIDPLRRDILDALWLASNLAAMPRADDVWAVDIPNLNARAALQRLMQVVDVLGWSAGRGIDRETR